MTDEWKNYEELTKYAAKSLASKGSICFFFDIPENLQEDKEFLSELLKTAPDIFEHLSVN